MEAIFLHDQGIYLLNGREIIYNDKDADDVIRHRTGELPAQSIARKGTMSYDILERHDQSQDPNELKLKFDLLAVHDLNGMNVIQTARAIGIDKFPVPMVITNCHNTLCTVGGTVNEDDHRYLLNAAEKYGGCFVPPGLSVIHQYLREMIVESGQLVLTADSHTRYGPLGVLATGEGCGEIVRQIVEQPYNFKRPETVCVYLTGKPKPGIGPHDLAIAIIGAVFKNSFVKNGIMEFVGDGVGNLSVDFRNGVDTMTTETTCWSSIWETDDAVKEYFKQHKRPQAYKHIAPAELAYYDKLVYVDLSKLEAMIALPFHPSNAYTIKELQQNPEDILYEVQKESAIMYGKHHLKYNLMKKIKNGAIHIDQGIIAGCVGGSFENITHAADILDGQPIGNGSFNVHVYSASQPIHLELLRNGSIEKLLRSGALIKPSVCGPCFGAGDTPAHGELSVRHVTRNFPNREGSVPDEGQVAGVALMDARSIAATARNGGILTAATEIPVNYSKTDYIFDDSTYKARVYNGIGKPRPEVEVQMGPNIGDWPPFDPMGKAVLLKLVAVYTDPVITTDDLLPSAASSYRSNPIKASDFALFLKDPTFATRAKVVRDMETARKQGTINSEIEAVLAAVSQLDDCKSLTAADISLGGSICGKCVGDGSAREVSASCQKVLGSWANIALSFATKRYVSNMKNWGMLPLIITEDLVLEQDDYILLPNVREEVESGSEELTAYRIRQNTATKINIRMVESTEEERRILIEGGLINYYRNQKNHK